MTEQEFQAEARACELHAATTVLDALVAEHGLMTVTGAELRRALLGGTTTAFSYNPNTDVLLLSPAAKP